MNGSRARAERKRTGQLQLVRLVKSAQRERRAKETTEQREVLAVEKAEIKVELAEARAKRGVGKVGS